VKNWQPFTLKFQRVVTAVRGNEVTVDAPVVNAIERRYGGGSLVRVRHPGRIENAGVENLRGDSVYDSPTDHAHAWRFIQINHAQDVWVRDVTARHMAYSCVQVDSQVRRATIQDSTCVDMISEIKGGLRYPFALSGQLCLVQRCTARDGRHDFVMHAWVPGPNVFLDCRSEQAHSDSGPHHRYATGTLYDNVDTGTLNVVNRGRSGTGHGWAGAQMVFWNCRAERMNVARPPTAQNFAIGCTVAQQPRGDGHWESVNKPVEPRSLYLRQLEDRLGPQAVRNIAAEAGRGDSDEMKVRHLGPRCALALCSVARWRSSAPRPRGRNAGHPARHRGVRQPEAGDREGSACLDPRSGRRPPHQGACCTRAISPTATPSRNGRSRARPSIQIEYRIPYVLCLGNHDYDGQTGRTSLANRVFRVAELRKSATFGGVFEEDRVDNHFQWIDLHGRKWLVLSLEFVTATGRPGMGESRARAKRRASRHRADPRLPLPRQRTLRPPARPAARHAPRGVRRWRRRRGTLAAGPPPPRQCHAGRLRPRGVGLRRLPARRGRPWQHRPPDDVRLREMLRGGGQGFLRLLEFHPDGRTVQVRTYSPVTGGSNPVRRRSSRSSRSNCAIRRPAIPSAGMPAQRGASRFGSRPEDLAITPDPHPDQRSDAAPGGAGQPLRRLDRRNGAGHRLLPNRARHQGAVAADRSRRRLVHQHRTQLRPRKSHDRRPQGDARRATPLGGGVGGGHLRTAARNAGFNTLGAWSREQALNKQARPFAYAKQLHWMAEYGARRKGTVPASGHTGFVNDCIFVFDPEFEAYCREKAAGLAATRDDPWLLGYFSDNELPFPEDALDRFLRLPESEAGFRAAREWLRLRRGSDAAGSDALSKEEQAAFLTSSRQRIFPHRFAGHERGRPQSPLSRLPLPRPGAALRGAVPRMRAARGCDLDQLVPWMDAGSGPDEPLGGVEWQTLPRERILRDGRRQRTGKRDRRRVGGANAGTSGRFLPALRPFAAAPRRLRRLALAPLSGQRSGGPGGRALQPQQQQGHCEHSLRALLTVTKRDARTQHPRPHAAPQLRPDEPRAPAP
jgi:hypothetical protein